MLGTIYTVLKNAGKAHSVKVQYAGKAHQYVRAICRAEQSASRRLRAMLTCSDSLFRLSRAAVRRSFLAFRLSNVLHTKP